MAENEEVVEQKQKSKKPWVFIITIVFLVLILLGGSVMGALYYAGVFSDKPAVEQSGEEGDVAEEIDEQPLQPAIYVPLDPPFVVNFEGDGRVRFLQITAEAMTRHQEVVELVQKHMPVIRNNLVLLFSSQTYENLSTLDGKENLRAAALEELQKILEEETGEPGVEALYFTSFVMQ
jgi:flagellar FliL protein